jgi:O-antigen/teichoic acid export membrane protein
MFSDSLYENSLYLMLTNIFGTGSGFFFWIFAAKLYSSDQVGLAVALISCMSLLSMFSMLGFDIGIIRYLPTTNNQNQMINSCLTIISVVSILLCIIFLAGLNVLSPTLIFLKDNIYYMVLFTLFTVAYTIFAMQINIFSAFRHSKYSTLQTVFSILRVIILPFIIIYGFLGMYFSFGIGILVASVLGNYYISKINKTYKFRPSFNQSMVKEIFGYSIKNYISTIFEGTPNYILPILVVNILGAKENAYFYIAWCFSSFFQMVPRSTSISLLVEGSNKESSIRKDTIHSIKFIYSLLIPAIILVFIFGKYILLFFGKEYAENSFYLFMIFAITSIPYTINTIYITVKRIQHRIGSVIYMHFFLGLFSILFSLLFARWEGILGVGIAWLLTNSIAAMFAYNKILK